MLRTAGRCQIFELLLKLDADLAAEARAANCRDCGGRLDSARYPRKPRGALTKLPDDYETKFSFCCAWCRHRNTPPTEETHRPRKRTDRGNAPTEETHRPRKRTDRGNAPTEETLHEMLGVSRRTLDRWRTWWRAAFIESAFWKAAKAFFSPPVAEAALPLSLLERFGADEQERLSRMLRFVRQLSTPDGYVADQRIRGASATRRGGS